jgi:alanine racemase
MKYHRPTAAEIDLDNFAHNIGQIREKVGNQKKFFWP